MNTIFLAFFILISIEATSHSSETKEIEFNVKKLCPEAKIIETEFKTGYYEIEFLCNNERIEVLFNDDFELIYTEKEVKISDEVFKKIQKKLNKSYEGWTFDELHLVETKDTSFYKVEMMKTGIEENVYFTTDGKYYKPSNLIFNENWTTDNLSVAFNNEKLPYNFLKPNKTFEMPEILREISGIAMGSENMIYCIQDETGILFTFDTKQGKITDMLRFTDIGDFEDVAINGDLAYVLRSDGTVFSFNYKNFDGKATQTIAATNGTDVEGLFFDRQKNLLFLACKTSPVNGNNDYRVIYEMAPDNIHKTQISFSISNNEINKMIAKKYPELASVSNVYQFNPSAIAVHPLTSEKYVLSALNRLLAIYKNKKLVNVFPLPSEIFYKPEGLAFSPDGGLYISSEGIKNGFVKGQILYFERK
ncbi:MAG: hypothetical protein FD181_2811 [Prolixibacteraceae bacterium]|nr:MAG: hypothetical protein FD181_2811 [Prolixibacteraceae bacterium]